MADAATGRGARWCRRVHPSGRGAAAGECTVGATRSPAACRLPRDLVDALKTAGVFRMSMPQAWGGSALPLPDQVRIVESLAYADPSVGWCATTGSDSGFYSAFLDDAAARELWTDIDDITAGWLFPGGQAVAVDGGYRVSGRWKFGSGCTHADVMVAGCIVMNGNGSPVLGPDGMPVVRTVSLGPIVSRSSTPGTRRASPAAGATTTQGPVRAGRAHVLVGRTGQA